MRSNEPIPGNPWPHDMVISVEDRPNALLELLWIREAYELQPRGEDLPPSLTDTPTIVRDAEARGDRAGWEDAWPRIWHAAASHAGRENDPRSFERIGLTADGSIERADLLRQMIGPTWREEFGDDAFAGDPYRIWSQRGADAHRAGMSRRLKDSPERRDLDALISAWRAGLTKIVTIPCSGEFTRKIRQNALLMTSATRDGSGRYRRALSTFV